MNSVITRQPSMYAQLLDSARQNPAGDALVYYKTRISFKQLLDLVHQCAAGLLANGVKKGDRITIVMPNMPQSVVTIYAVNMIGAICNMLHPLSTGSEVQHAVQLVDSKFGFCFDVSEKTFDHLPMTVVKCKTAQYFEKTPMGILRSMVYKKRIKDKVGAASVDQMLDWTDLLSSGAAFIDKNGLPVHDGQPEDTAAIMYTGGTTGHPKGVKLSNAAVNALSFQMFPVSGKLNAWDSMMCALPVFHGFGFALCMHTAICGATRLVLVPRFDPADCCKMILQEKISMIFGVPAFFEGLLKCKLLEGKDLSFIRLIGSGGDMVTDDLKKNIDALMAAGGSKTSLISGYGLTECVTACTFDAPDPAIKTGCVGKPFQGNEMKIVQMGSTDEITDGDGEICITGPTLMEGYWNDDDETAKVLKVHKDGRLWLHTGDLGAIGSDGNLYFRQRLKRVLKVSGYLIYPSQIEDRLRCNALVDDCCVVGIETDKGTRVKAFVVPQHPPRSASAALEMKQQIKNYSSEYLNMWSVPAELEFLDELPRTKIGKVDFKVLESMMG